MAARRTIPLLALAAVVTGLLSSAGSPAASAGGPPDRSAPPTRALVDQATTGQARELPRRDARNGVGTAERENPPLLVAGPAGADPVVQSASAPAAAAVAGAGFAGLGVLDNAFATRYAPPDTNGDVGPTHYVQSVNTMFAVYDKATGGLLATPFFASQLFTALTSAGAACAQQDDGDPVVQYDPQAGRWLLTQFQVSVTPYLECVAVSDGPDPLGTYTAYAYDYGTDFVDYPKVGVWGDGYYVSYNVFRNGSFAGGEVCVLDRAGLLAGTGQRPQQCFFTSTSLPSLLPADSDDPTLPGGASYLVDIAAGRLNAWRLAVDWTTPAASALSGPVNLGAAAFSPACNGGTCIVQRGTKQKLDSLADRLMNRFATVALASGERRFVVTHAVALPATSRKPTPSSGVRWYELRSTGGGPLGIVQQGTYAPDATMRWMSSAALDRRGGIAVGYSASSSTVYPSVRAAVRAPGDPAGTLGAEVVLKEGLGSQAGSNLSRWGDYASMSLDPDGCRLWFTTEYLKGTGAFNWSTWISSVTVPGCT